MSEIRHRVGINSTITEVYEATYHPEKLEEWWAESAKGSTTVGSQIELKFSGYPNHVWQIAERVENRRVRLDLLSGPLPWLGSQLLFEFEESDKQVYVTFVHKTGPETPSDAVQFFQTKWPMFLVSLKRYLETGKGMPYPDDIKIQ